MATIQYKEIPKRSYSISATERKITRVYQCRQSVATDHPNVAVAAVGISLYDQHPAVTNAYCTNISVDEPSPLIFEVTYTYEKIDACEIDPTTCDPVISWSTVQVEEIVDEDTAGDAIVNSAGDPYDPPVFREAAHIQLEYQRNYSSFDGATAFSWANKINNATFEGAAAKTLRVAGIKANSVDHELIGTYWQTTVSLAYNPNTWTKSILNAGMRKLDGGGDRVPITINGKEISAPVALDAAGTDIAAVGAEEFNEHDVYEDADFSTLFS